MTEGSGDMMGGDETGISHEGLLANRMAAGEFGLIYDEVVREVSDLSPERQANRWAQLVAQIEENSSHLSDASAQAQMDLIVGRILEHQLHLLDDALEFYLSAQRNAPSVSEAFGGARRIYAEQGNYRASVEMGAIEIALMGDDAGGADSALQDLARICDEKLGNASAAFRWAYRALKVDPQNASMQAILDRRSPDGASELSDYEELLNSIESIRDRRQRSAVLLERASAWFDANPGNPWVEDILVRILSKDPRNEPARDLLDEFYEQGKRWSELVNYLVKRAKSTPRKSSRLEIYKRLAEVSHFGQKDEDAAVQWHREVLKLAAGEKASLQYCVNYFSARDDWNGLVATYEAALKTRRRGSDEAAMLIQIAMLLWRKIEDSDRAEPYFRRIKVGQPKHPQMLIFYTEYFEQKGDIKRLLNVLSARQSAAEHLDEKVELGRQMATLAELELGSKEKAIDLWKGILRIAPNLEEGHGELRRLYTEANKWNALIELLKGDLRSSENAEPEVTISILEEMVVIYRDRLKLPVMVANVYNQILEFDPSNRNALEALEARFREASRWNDLLNILDRRAQLALESNHQDEFIDIAREAAGLLKSRNSGIDRAAEYYHAILSILPDDQEALHSLLGIYKKRRDWEAYLNTQEQLLDTLPSDDARRLLSEMAATSFKQLQDVSRAIGYQRQVVDADPSEGAAWDTLEDYVLRNDDAQLLADVYSDRSGFGSVAEQIEALRKLASLCEDSLEDFERSALAWHGVLELLEDDVEAMERLQRIYLDVRDWDALESLLAPREEWKRLANSLAEGIPRVAEVEAQVHLLGRLAEIRSEKLSDMRGASECWELILELSPGDETAGESLIRYYRSEEDWSALASALAIKAAINPDAPRERLELGGLFGGPLDDPAAAFKWYSEALRILPGRVDILTEAVDQGRRSNDTVQVIELLEANLENADEAKSDYFRLLLALYSEVGNHEHTLRALEGLAELDALTSEERAEQGRLYELLGRWLERIQIYELQFSQASDTEAQVDILRAQSIIYAEMLEDDQSAMAALERLIEIRPADIEALRTLQSLAERLGDDASLVDFLGAELSQLDDPKAIGALRLRLGVVEMRQGAEGIALEHYVAALEADAECPSSLEGVRLFLDTDFAERASDVLLDHYRRFEEWRLLADVLEKRSQFIDEPSHLVDNLLELGRLERDQLMRLEQAFDRFTEAQAVGGSNPSLRDEYLQLAASVQREADAASLFERMTFGGDLCPADLAEAQAIADAVCALAEGPLNDPARARRVLEEALLEQGEVLSLLQSLERVTAAQQDWELSAEAIERQIEAHGSRPDLQSAELARLAQLYETKLDSMERAADAYERALEMDSAGEGLHENLERLYQELGDYEPLVTMLEARLLTAEGPERAEQLIKLGLICSEGLEQYSRGVTFLLDAMKESHHSDMAVDALREVALRTQGTPDYTDVGSEIYPALYAYFKEAENWDELSWLLHLHASECESGPQRLAYRVELAALMHQQLGDGLGAFAVYGSALLDDGGSTEIVDALIELSLAFEAWSELAGLLEAVLSGEGDAPLEAEIRAYILLMAAKVLSEQDGHQENAAALYAAFLEEEPENLEVLAALASLYARVGAREAEAETLKAQLELVEGSDAIDVGLRLGRIYEEHFSRPEEAIEVYQSLRGECVGRAAELYKRLVPLLGAGERWDELVGVLVEEAEALDSDPRAVDLLMRAGEIYEGVLDAPDEAATAYERVLEYSPGFAEALIRLDRIYGSAGRAPELLEIVEAQLETAHDGQERISLEMRRGRLLAEELDDNVEALKSFERVADADPSFPGLVSILEELVQEEEVHTAASRILNPMYHASEDWTSLAALLRLEVDFANDEVAQAEKWRELGKHQEERLKSQTEAFDAYGEAYLLSGSDDAVEYDVERIGMELEAYSRLCELWLDRAERDPERQVELRLKIANLSEIYLNDADRAIDEYQEVLSIDSRSLAAFDALEQLYTAHGRPDDAIGLLEQRLTDGAGPEEQVPILFRIAGLYDDSLNDSESAAEAYRRILSISPGDQSAMGGIERYLESEERWGDLNEQLLYRRQHLGPDDSVESVDLVRAQICESALEDGETALSLFLSCMESEPHREDAYQGVRRLFLENNHGEDVGLDGLGLAQVLEGLSRDAGDAEALMKCLAFQLESADPEPTLEPMCLELIALYQGQEAYAEPCFFQYERLLEIAPSAGNRKAFRSFSQSIDRSAEYAERLLDVIQALDGQDERIAALLELADVYRRDLGESSEGEDVLRSVLDEVPGHEEAINALTQEIRHREGWLDLYELYLAQGESVEEPSSKCHFFGEAAHLAEEILGESDRAVAAWREVLEVDPVHQRGSQALERIYEAAKEWPELADYYVDQIERVEESDRKDEIRILLARLYLHKLGETSNGIEQLRTVIEAGSPQCAAAVEDLEQLLFQLNSEAPEEHARLEASRLLSDVYASNLSWPDWMAMQEIALEFADGEWARQEILVEMARHQIDVQNDASGALGTFGRAFAEDFGNENLRSELEQVAATAEEWSGLAQIYEDGVDDCDDDEAAVSILVRLAELYSKQLGAHQGSVHAHVRILDRTPDSISSLDELLELLPTGNDPEAYLGLLERRAELTDDVDLRMDFYRRAGRLAEAELGDLIRASDYWSVVSEEGEPNVDDLYQLSRLQEAQEDWEATVETLRARIERSTEEEKKTVLSIRLAEIFDNHLGDSISAIEVLQSVCSLGVSNDEVYDRLSSLLEREEQWHELVELLESRRTSMEGADLDMLDIRIGDLSRTVLAEGGRALSLYEMVLSRSEANEQALAGLEALIADEDWRGQAADILIGYYETRSATDLARVLEARLSVTFEELQQAELWVYLGDVQGERLGRVEDALESYGSALDALPNRPGLIETVVGMLENQELQSRGVDLLEASVDTLESGESRMLALRTLGRACQSYLDDGPRASAWWEVVLEDAPGDEEALEALSGIYLQEKAWEDFGRTLSYRLEASSGQVAAELSSRLGRISEVIHGDTYRAIELHKSALQSCEMYPPALKELRRLAGHPEFRETAAEILMPVYVQAEQWEDAAILSEMRAQGAEAPEIKADYLVVASQLRRSRLAQPKYSFENLRSAFLCHPTDSAIRTKLMEDGVQDDRLMDVCVAFETVVEKELDPERLLDDRLRVAEWRSEVFGDRSIGIGHYRAALDLDPSNVSALSALERLYAQGEDWESLVSNTLQKSEGCEDLNARCDLLFKAGQLVIENLLDGPRAASLFEECLSFVEDYQPALDALEDLYTHTENWAELLRVLEMRLDLANDASMSVPVLLQIADVQGNQLGDQERAMQSLEDVIDLDQDNRQAIDELRGLYQIHERWGRLQELLDKELMNCTDDLQRLGLLHELADISEHQLTDTALAADYLGQAFDADPSDSNVIKTLDALMSSLGEFAQLAQLIRRHVESLGPDEGSYRKNWLIRLGDLSIKELMDEDMGLAALEEALECDPQDSVALQSLAGLYEQRGDWAMAVSKLQSALASDEQEPGTYIRLARIHEEELSDIDSALEMYQRALEVEPILAAVEPLCRLYQEREEHEQLDALLSLKIDLVDGADRQDTLMELAEIRGAAGDHDSQFELIKNAYELDPSRLNIGESLAAAYMSFRQVAEADALLRDLAGRYAEKGRPRDQLRCLRLRCTFATDDGRESDALGLLQNIVELDPADAQAAAQLGGILAKTGQWDGALKYLQVALLQQARLDADEKVALFLGLGRTRQGLGELRKAKDMYTRVLSIESENEVALKALESLEESE